MFGIITTEEHSYLLMGVYKNNVMYPASYFQYIDENGSHIEYISCLTSGNIYYSIHDFVSSIIGMNSINNYNDWIHCQFYDEDNKSWFPLFYLRPDKDAYINIIVSS